MPPKVHPDDFRYRRDIRFSNREWAAVVEKAAAAGFKPNEYLRRLAAGGRVRPRPSPTDRAAWGALARVYANLNQIARNLNLAAKGADTRVTVDDVAAAIDECQRLTEALRDDLTDTQNTEPDSEPGG